MEVPGSRGASAGTTGGGAGVFVVGFAASLGGRARSGTPAVTEALALPISIVLPAARPPWSAISLSLIAVTAGPRRARRLLHGLDR